jgi:hypothetical protein
VRIASKKENSPYLPAECLISPEPEGLMQLDRLEEILLLQEMLALQLIP